MQAGETAGQGAGQFGPQPVQVPGERDAARGSQHRGGHEQQFDPVGEVHVRVAEHRLEEVGPVVAAAEHRRDAEPAGRHRAGGEQHERDGDHPG